MRKYLNSPQCVKYIIAIVLVLLSVVVCIFAYHTTAAESAEGLYSTSEVLDIGRVEEGHKQPCVFRLKNRRPEGITIKNVSSGCSCMKAVASKIHVEPGEEFDITVDWSARNQPGKQTDLIQVAYTTKSNRSLVSELCITSTVETDVIIDPMV